MSHPNKGKMGDMGSDPRFYKSPKRHPDDIIVWPDKTWCYREELWKMDYMSDDFCVIYIDTPEHKAFLEENE